MENKDLIINALVAKGMNRTEAEEYVKTMNMDSLNMVNEYIKKADEDPSLMSPKNCEDGKCYSAEINFKHCKKHLKR